MNSVVPYEHILGYLNNKRYKMHISDRQWNEKLVISLNWSYDNGLRLKNKVFQLK
jgi:hypothetical protein